MNGNENLKDYEYNVLASEACGEVEVKKSRFIAAVRECRTEDEARSFIEEIKKKHYDARHNCFALRIGSPEKVSERFSDDGEPQGTAGKPMLDILKGNELYNVCAVVTRYFGGTLLGTGGLVRAYSDALKDALCEKNGISPLMPLCKGKIISVISDYSYINKVKYTAEKSELYPYSEIYLEKCKLSYVVPLAKADGFAMTITEMSAGKAEVLCEENVLYGEREKSVFIYGRF